MVAYTVDEIREGKIAVREHETTNRTDALDQEMALLAQRETLLRECDHRLKNSLQLISSVLALQARNSADPALQEGFLQASRRVGVLGRMHERLHSVPQAKEVDLAAYLKDLCADLTESLTLSTEQSIEVEAADAAVPADQVIQLGLVLNKLITNALKHGGRSGSLDAYASASPATPTVRFSSLWQTRRTGCLKASTRRRAAAWA